MVRVRSVAGLTGLVCLVLVGGERTARASGPPAIEIALRAGYALPAGNLSGDSGTTKGLVLGDSIRGQVPLSADLGVRPIPKVYIGGYFSYGFGILPGDACATGVSCSAHDLRFGLDVSFHALAGHPLDPWIGVGAGYEILAASASMNGTSADLSFHGFEIGHVQAGLDIKSAGIGPFVLASLGEYSGASLNGTAADNYPSSMHSWIELGIRGYFDIVLGPKYDDDPDADSGNDRNFLKPTPRPPPPVVVGEPPPIVVAAPTAPLPPAPPIVFPPGVKMASRSQCTLLCSSGGTPVPPGETARVEIPLGKHLEALRACSLEADRRHQSPAISVQFDAAGVGHALLHLNQSSESMRGCVARFPAAPPIPGPANATWSCEDMCN